jgi:hypothetical protein
MPHIKTFTHIALSLLAALSIVGFAGFAQAEPILQLYVEGATYNTSTESWDITSESGTVNVWVIANTDAGGSQGTVYDVNLTVAYDSSDTDAAVSYDGDEQFDQVGTAVTGTSPVLQDGSSMPSHGIYGAGTSYQQFSLGDFDETTSPIADFQGEMPELSGEGGDIEIYSLTFTGTGSVHLDAFGYVINERNQQVIVRSAPFSHDADVTFVPELSGSGSAPGLALLLGGALILGGRRRRSV